MLVPQLWRFGIPWVCEFDLNTLISQSHFLETLGSTLIAKNDNQLHVIPTLVTCAITKLPLFAI